MRRPRTELSCWATQKIYIISTGSKARGRRTNVISLQNKAKVWVRGVQTTVEVVVTLRRVSGRLRFQIPPVVLTVPIIVCLFSIPPGHHGDKIFRQATTTSFHIVSNPLFTHHNTMDSMYVGYSESKNRLRISLAHPRDCRLCACAVTSSINWETTDAISWNLYYVYVYVPVR